MITDADLGTTGTVTIHMARHTEPVIEAPAEAVSVQPDMIGGGTITVHDELGARVGSYPFISAERLTHRIWRFVGPTDDFTLTIKETT